MPQYKPTYFNYPVLRVLDMVAGIEPTSKTARSWFTEGIDGITWQVEISRGRPYSSIQWTLEFIYAVNGRKPPRGAQQRLEPYTRLRPVQKAFEMVLCHEVDYSTIWRWHEPDGDGPRLRTYTLRRRRLTTVEHVVKFLQRTNRWAGSPVEIPKTKVVTSQDLAHLPQGMLKDLDIKLPG